MERYIPLFPLSTVLFPGVSIDIQVFEERYKKMVVSVLNTNKQIGIFCIKEGIEAHGPLPIPYEYGTLGQIYQHDPIENLYSKNSVFRMSVMGLKKIKLIHYYESVEKYYIGNVIIDEEYLHNVQISTEEKEYFFSEAKFYLKHQSFENLDRIDPNNVVLLCHLTLHFLNIPLEEKQKLLELSSFQERWNKTLQILKYKNQIIHQIEKTHRFQQEDVFN
ncbi:MAG: LON peptidase substrate-binding domain-containing protein [Leptospiraceae bacterium]|nr:LON peptidase substrate-binding domain-containing protein [Leptospiraceae bacterium]